jgi:hypothetical protein
MRLRAALVLAPILSVSTNSAATRLCEAEGWSAVRASKAHRTASEQPAAQLDFVPIEGAVEASKTGKVIVLDTPLPKSQTNSNMVVIDHHGDEYRNVRRPNQNTTSKVLDAYDKAERELKLELAANGKTPTPTEVQERMLKNLLGMSKHEALPAKISVSTDNAGDAALANYLLNNPSLMATVKDRSRLRLATFHEDFGVFGTRTTALAQGNEQAADAIRLSEAIMQSNDDVIALTRADPSAQGAFLGSDRFNGIPAERQREIMAASQERIRRVFEDPAYRNSQADAFRQRVDGAAREIRARALVSPDSGVLQSIRPQLSPEEFKAFTDNVAVVDGTKIPPGGQFSNWGAVSAAHSKPYQIQTFPKGPGLTGYIVSIPQGRKDLGAINDRILKALEAAGGKGFMMRDSGLLFNFAGDSLPPETVMQILAREMAPAFRR